MNVLKGICSILVIALGAANIYFYDVIGMPMGNDYAVAEVQSVATPDEPEPEVADEPIVELIAAEPEPNVEVESLEVTDEPEVEELEEPDEVEEPEIEELEVAEPEVEELILTEAWLTDKIRLSGVLHSEEGDAVVGDALFGEFHRWIESSTTSVGSSEREATYFLEGRYALLEAEWESNGMATLEIFADDRMIYTQVTNGGELIPISVDVTDCLRLRVLVNSIGPVRATIWNPRLLPNPNFAPQEPIFAATGMPTWLVDIEPVVNNRNRPIRLDRSPGTSNTGELFTNSINRANAGEYSADWRLDGQHTRLAGVFTIDGRRTISQGMRTSLTIELDDEEVFSALLQTGDLPIPVDIDISGKQKLTIRFSDSPSGVFANAALFE